MSGSCSNTSYMYMTDVQTMVQTNHKYGLAFNRNVNNPADGGHTTAIVGYAGSTSSSYYIFFDPHRAGPGNYTTGTFYLDSSLRQFTSQGVTYKWQDGYISNIDISNMN